MTLPTVGRFIPVILKSRNDYKNVIWGGPGTVRGTTKIGSTLVKRRVRLYEAGTGILIREMWSGNDGTYTFPGMRTDIKYTVSATDYSGAYNDVIAANVVAV